MDIINISLLATSIINSGFLLFIFSGRSENKFFKIFFLNNLSIVLWIFSMMMYSEIVSGENVFFARILYISATFIATTFFYFTYVFPFIFKKFIFKYIKIILFFINILFAYFIFFTDLFIKRVLYITESENQIIFGPYFPLYIMYILTFFIAGFVILILKYKKEKNEVLKKQTALIGMGYFISSNISLTTNLILPYLGNFSLNWVGQISTGFLVGYSIYGVVKHKLFNFKAILSEFFISLLWITLFIRIFNFSTLKNLILDSVIFVSSLIIGVYIIKVILNEINIKEKFEIINKNLIQRNIELKRISDEKTEFISLASHQIRAPIASIRGYLSMLREGDFGPITDGTKKVVDILEISSKNMNDVVADYLDASRIEIGKMKYDISEFNIIDVLDECFRENKENAKRKNLEFTINTDAIYKEERYIYNFHADKNKFKQIITNLIDNAIKYTPQGFINIEIFHDEKMIHVSIKDSGVGVEKELIPKLFKKFSRAENARDVNIMGTGLGLFIAKNFAEASGGFINIFSEGKGKGSVFSVILPLHVDISKGNFEKENKNIF